MVTEQKPRWQHYMSLIPTPIQVAGGLILALALILLLYRYSLATGTTLWDWLKLLVVPAAIAGVGIWFNWTLKARELSIQNQRAQDAALQAYLDQMTTLLTDNKLAEQLRDLQSKEGYNLRVLARARTLTVLEQLGRARKRSVLQFLYEAALISKSFPIVSLKGASLNDANLRDLILYGAYLREAYLIGSDLRGADLSKADLRSADLRQTDLRNTFLGEGDLQDADLRNAKLKHAHLENTDLRNAVLCEADLSHTSLRGADFERANLKGADLSNASLGFTYGPRELEEIKELSLSIQERTVAWNAIPEANTQAFLVLADLSYASLEEANLKDADLSNVNLHKTNLRAADLTRANLVGAHIYERANKLKYYLDSDGRGVPREQLEQARSLAEATMPNGKKYEDWVAEEGPLER